MSVPPHGYQTGFTNAQQAVMRSQFAAGATPQIPGLMSNQQPGMVGQPGYGGGVVGMQQPLAQQQQQQQMQLQQQQQMQMQQQQIQMQQQAQQAQAQQQQVVGGNQPPAQQQGPKEFNTASLCRFGQETVQEVVSRTQEIFQNLKAMQPPNGTPQGAATSNEKKVKMVEQMKMIRLLFKRLRVIYEKCTESLQLQGMEYMHIESLIPLKEEWDMKSEEKKTSEQYRVACDESKEVMEQVIVKNKQLKEVIDIMRRIIWEINTMLTMRRS